MPLGTLAAVSHSATISKSLDPYSISQAFAFYRLYPDTPEGKKALQRAFFLLSGSNMANIPEKAPLIGKDHSIEAIIALINKQPFDKSPTLLPKEIEFISRFSKRLSHYKLKGHNVKREEEVLALPPEEIDLARGLFLSQFGKDPDGWDKILSYEATIDLMALQIQARLKPNATPREKILAINHFIFEEMEFRFPPHSLYAKDVDLYTFLPNVLDSRRGVCLGVSLLYLCIAQRLDLNLEIVTPPGHIYVRCRIGDELINIETTARGIDTDSKMYLGINTRKIQERNIKDVIGLAYINQASTFWIHNKYEEALTCYTTALKYLPDDPLLKELMGYNYVMLGQEEEGKKLLREVVDYLPDHAVAKESLAEEYLSGKTDREGIAATFMHVDDKRESVLKKRDRLAACVAKCPEFKSGLLNLGMTLLQLYREGDALDQLNRYHAQDPNNPTAEYVLSIINAKRMNYPEAWRHFHRAEALTLAREHKPEALKELRQGLTIACPE